MNRINRGMSLTWLGHATFKLVTREGRTVLIDPWVEGNPACPASQKTFDRLDVIAITHGHSDHMADAVTLAKKFQSTVVSIFEIHQILQQRGVTATSPMSKGGSQQVHGLRFTMTHAIHSSSVEEGGRLIYAGEPCGYVITLEDGLRIYFAGDTGVHGDMAIVGELYRPEIAVLPIGDLYTMGPREAAYAARMIGARVIVPCHFGTFPALTGTPEALREHLAEFKVAAEVVALQPGQSLQ
jgi:L-ascorbate metabolism protein UlaG (beta-lactamase superfamily)